MGRSERAVAALARAYSMSEVLSFEDANVRAQIECAASGDEELVFRVGPRGIIMSGELQEDSDGSLSELARDLGLAGVEEVRIPPYVAPESVEDFTRSLRDGIDQLRRRLEGLSEISVSFRSVTAWQAFGGEAGTDASAGYAEASEPGGPMTAGEPPDGTAFPDSGEGPDTAVPDSASGASSAAAGAPSSAEEEVGGPGAEATATEPSAPREPEAAISGEPQDPEKPEAVQPPDLLPLVEAYLDAAPLERREVAEELREAAEEASALEAYGPVAEVVEELVLDSELGSGRPESLQLARDLFDAEVAPSIVRRLGALRDDLERDRRVRVATTLRGPMSEAFAEALAETDDRGARHAYLDALIAMGEDGREEAKRMLDDSRWWVVRNGATILGGTGTGADVEDLTAHLAHDDARVRLQVVRSLGRIGGEDAGMLLLGMVDDPDPDVRAGVATALGAMGIDRAVKFLLERLEIEEEQKVEVQILRALGALGDPGAVPSIEKRAAGAFFSKPATPVRVAAYRALGSIGTPRATQLLEEARDDRDDEVRRAVRGILERKGG